MGSPRNGAGRWWKPAALLLVVAVTRMCAVGLLHALVNGREYTDDPRMHLDMAARPLGLLAGDTALFGQHPVLLPAVEWLLLAPFRHLGEFTAIRLASVAAELLLVGALWAIVNRPEAEGWRRPVLTAAIISPVLWAASVLVPQDEVFAAAVLATALALWVRGRERPAIAVLGIGVAAAKIFLLLPLVALVVLGPPATRRLRAAVAAVTATVPYAVSAINARVSGNPLPLTGFTPIGDFGVNLWVLALRDGGIALETAKNASLVLGLAGAAVPLALVALRSPRDPAGESSPAVIGAVTAAMLLWFFALFYQTNPDYLLLTVPAMCLLALGVRDTVLAHAGLALPWLVNLFYGVMVAEQSSGPERGGKQVFVDLYRRTFPVEPATLHRLSIVASTVVIVVLAVACTRAATRRTTAAPGPADPESDGPSDLEYAVLDERGH